MHNSEEDLMTPLDQMISEYQLQILKAAVPYASSHLQPTLAVLAKTLELMRTVQLFSRPADLMMMSAADTPHTDPLDMVHDIARFAGKEQKEALENMIQTVQTLQLMRSMEDKENG